MCVYIHIYIYMYANTQIYKYSKISIEDLMKHPLLNRAQQAFEMFKAFYILFWIAHFEMFIYICKYTFVQSILHFEMCSPKKDVESCRETMTEMILQPAVLADSLELFAGGEGAERERET